MYYITNPAEQIQIYAEYKDRIRQKDDFDDIIRDVHKDTRIESYVKTLIFDLLHVVQYEQNDADLLDYISRQHDIMLMNYLNPTNIEYASDEIQDIQKAVDDVKRLHWGEKSNDEKAVALANVVKHCYAMAHMLSIKLDPYIDYASQH